MSPVERSEGEDDSPAQKNLPSKRPRSNPRERSSVRGLRGRLRRKDLEDRLPESPEFHKLTPEHEPIAQSCGGPGERARTLENACHAEEGAHPDRALRAQAMAQRYIQENFDPEDWLAVVVRKRHPEETVQRISTARQISSPEFQAWLRHKNANGSDIYISLNTLKEHANGRTKADLKDIRHLYVDLDEDGRQRLAAIYEDGRVPLPNYVLQTSPGKYQVVWRVEGIAHKDAEDLLRGLARRFGGDPAATDATRVFRLPGFHNKKYSQNFPVKPAAGRLPERVYHQSDFRIEPISAALLRETGTVARPHVSVAGAVSPESVKTQSERDWAYAIRHLRRGDNPEDIIREIAAFRATNRYDSQDSTQLVSSPKPNPRYYAEHTVSRAMHSLGIARSTNTKASGSQEIEPDR